MPGGGFECGGGRAACTRTQTERAECRFEATRRYLPSPFPSVSAGRFCAPGAVLLSANGDGSRVRTHPRRAVVSPFRWSHGRGIRASKGVRERKRAHRKVSKTVYSAVYEGSNYRAIHSYDRGRDAKGGQGVKWGVRWRWRQGLDCQRSEPRYGTAKCGNGVAGYTGPGEGLQVQWGGGRGP